MKDVGEFLIELTAFPQAKTDAVFVLLIVVVGPFLADVVFVIITSLLTLNIVYLLGRSIMT